MKRIILLLSLLLIGRTEAWATPTCAESLGNVFTPAQRVQLCSIFGSAITGSLVPNTDNAYDLGSTSKTWRTLYTGTSIVAKTSEILRVRQDPQRLFTFDGSSDTALTLAWGDGGTTATQTFTIASGNADADDDSTLFLSGGGAYASDGTRGSGLRLSGNEDGNGDTVLNSGAVSGGDVILSAPASNGNVYFQTAGQNRWSIANGGKLTQDATNGDSVIFSSATAAKSTILQAADSVGIGIGGGTTVAQTGANGAVIQLQGGTAGGGTAGYGLVYGGAFSTGSLYLGTTHASASILFRGGSGGSAGNNTLWSITNTGVLSNDGTNGSDINFSKPGTTIAIQESSAGAACSGSVTANATTPVVTSTTCATTAQRLFLTKTSNSTVNGSCYQSAISNGVSFSITCLATDTGTYNWFILHESP